MSEHTNNLKVQILSSEAKIPIKMTAESAGFDLFASEDIEIPASTSTGDNLVDIGRALVPTGIAVELPRGTVGRVGSRSGLSTKNNIEVGAGWIDSDFRGELNIELKNLSSKPYQVKIGDRIAQLIIIPLVGLEITIVAELNESNRSIHGFGSTG